MSAPRNLTIGAMLAAAIIAADGAQAAVLDGDAGGFALRETAEIAAPPEAVWATLVAPSKWWSPEHSYSHAAANFTLDPHAGGCWCETLPEGGSVEHMHVVFVAPGKTLRLTGGLGPFQAFADGALTITLAAVTAGTQVTFDYVLFGYRKDGLAALAPAADRVLGEQVSRLKSQIETGSPESPNGEKP